MAPGVEEAVDVAVPGFTVVVSRSGHDYVALPVGSPALFTGSRLPGYG